MLERATRQGKGASVHGVPNVWATPYHTAESLGAGTPPAAPLSGGGDAPAGGPRRAGPGPAARTEKCAFRARNCDACAPMAPKTTHAVRFRPDSAGLRCGPPKIGAIARTSPSHYGPLRTDVGRACTEHLHARNNFASGCAVGLGFDQAGFPLARHENAESLACRSASSGRTWCNRGQK